MGREIADMSKNIVKIGDLGEKISDIGKKLGSIEDKVNKPTNANATSGKTADAVVKEAEADTEKEVLVWKEEEKKEASIKAKEVVPEMQ